MTLDETIRQTAAADQDHHPDRPAESPAVRGPRPTGEERAAPGPSALPGRPLPGTPTPGTPLPGGSKAASPVPGAPGSALPGRSAARTPERRSAVPGAPAPAVGAVEPVGTLRGPGAVPAPPFAAERRRAASPAQAVPPGIAALVRLAVLCVDPEGRVSYWNRGAEELFGHRWEHVFGHPASGLLSTARRRPAPGAARSAVPRHDTLDLLEELARPAWAGALAATDRDGVVKDVLWWAYRIEEPGGPSLLAIAAHAKPLRAGGLRIALGGRLLPYAAEGPQRQDLAVAAVFAPPDVPSAQPDPHPSAFERLSDDQPAGRGAEPSAGSLPDGSPDKRSDDQLDALLVDPDHLAEDASAGRGGAFATAASGTALLAAVLPGASPGRRDRLARQVAALGNPALDVEGGVRLPVLPHDHARPAAARGRARELVSGPRRDGPVATATGPIDLTAASALTAVPPPVLPAPSPPSAREPLDRPPSPAAYASRGDPAGPPVEGYGRYPEHGDAEPGPARRPVAGTALDEQLALLRAAGAMVGTTLDVHTTARELCAVTVPRFADGAAVLVVDGLFSDGEPHAEIHSAGTVLLRRVAAVHGEPQARWEAALPEDELLTMPADAVVPGHGEPVLVPVVDPALAPAIARDLGAPEMSPLLAGCSLIVAPLTARGTVLGRIGFLRGPDRRPFDAQDAATAGELAARGAVHLDNARLHRQESQAAATLQRSMMPTRPPRIPGVRIAHHYMPGDRQAQVGGDWFDAIQLPGGRVALIVGDVMGHGLQAAAVMGQFRTAVITMAALDLPPAQLLRHLDNLAHRLGSEHLATCVYAVYDPIHRTLSVANAGHIPPVLAGSDGRGELLAIPGGAPIGVGGVPFETVEVPAPDGSWLVLCTDGLVEVRGQGIDAGLAALCANVIEPQQSPEDVCAQILGRVHSEDRGDDVALLVARFEGVDPQDVVRWTLLVDDGEVARARELTRRQLAEWGLERLTDTTELLVSELVTNAIKAASYEVELRLMRVGKLLVEVSDDNHNLPQLQRAEADDVRGRGLALVSHLSRRWGTSRKAVGKVVWFELPLPS